MANENSNDDTGAVRGEDKGKPPGNGIYDPWQRDNRSFFQRVIRRSETPFVVIGAALMILIVAFIFFLPGNDNHTDEVSRRLALLEEQVGNLAETVSKLSVDTGGTDEAARLKEQMVACERFVDRFDSVEASISMRVDRIARDLSRLGKDVAQLRVKKKKETAPGKEKKAPAKAGSKPVYHFVKSGDTLYRISARYNLTISELRRLNRLATDATIYPGQKLLVGTTSDQKR